MIASSLRKKKLIVVIATIFLVLLTLIATKGSGVGQVESGKEEELKVEEISTEEEGLVEHGGEVPQDVSDQDFYEQTPRVKEETPLSDQNAYEAQINAEESFEVSGFSQSMFKKTPTGIIRELTLGVSEEGVDVIDLSEYKEEIFAFKWAAGNFEYGLSDQLKIPVLKKVEVSDEIGVDLGILVSDLIALEGNRYVFIKPIEVIEDLKIHLFGSQSGGVGGLLGQANHSSGASYSTLGIIPREVWSGDPDINNPNRLVWDPVYYKATRVVIHHTVTPNNEDPIYWMKTIYNYHTYSMGLGDIGYNYLIDQYGNIYEGKLGGDEAKGYHAGSNGNPNSVGVSVIGTYTSEAPSAAAQNALIRLMAEKAVFYNFNLGWHSTVFGHRDFMATACPGEAFYNQLPNIVASANAYKAGNFSSMKSIVSQVDEDIANGDYKPGKLALIYDKPSDISIPAWSGIDNYKILDNVLTLEITEVSCPYEEVKERLRTLYKISLLEGEAEYIGLIHKGDLL